MKAKFFLVSIVTLIIFLGAKTTLADVDHYEICLAPVKDSPFVKTTDLFLIGTSSTKVTAKINPNNVPTKYWFEYGTSEKLNMSSGFVYGGDDNLEKDVELVLKDLNPNTTYYFRIVAENNLDTAKGEILSFKTNNS